MRKKWRQLVKLNSLGKNMHRKNLNIKETVTSSIILMEPELQRDAAPAMTAPPPVMTAPPPNHLMIKRNFRKQLQNVYIK
jgi:hypothetical protein